MLGGLSHRSGLPLSRRRRAPSPAARRLRNLGRLTESRSPRADYLCVRTHKHHAPFSTRRICHTSCLSVDRNSRVLAVLSFATLPHWTLAVGSLHISWSCRFPDHRWS